MKKIITLLSFSAVALTMAITSCTEIETVEVEKKVTIRDTINVMHIDSFYTVDPNSVYQKIENQYAPAKGWQAINLVVDKFLGNVVADSRINARFSAANAAHLRVALVDQVCEAVGGPCRYQGLSMKDAHTTSTGKEFLTNRQYNVSMITSDEFTALVEDLISAMDFYALNADSKNAILGALGPMQSDIVGNQ